MVEKRRGKKSPREEFSEEGLEYFTNVRVQSACLLPDRWLEVICDGGEFSDQERQHVSTCQHCQRSQARWLIAKKTKIVEDGPKASQWASLSDLTDQDIRDWVGQMHPRRWRELVRSWLRMKSE